MSYEVGNGTPPAPCGLPPPVFDDAPCCPCSDVPAISCGRRTDAKHYVEVPSTEVERAFAVNGCGEFVLYRKGACAALFTVTPYRRLVTGEQVVRWPEVFTSLKSGYYELVFTVDGNECAAVLLYLTPCTQRIASHTATVATTCGNDCGLPIDGTSVTPTPCFTGCNE